jgi:hypothetical protein
MVRTVILGGERLQFTDRLTTRKFIYTFCAGPVAVGVSSGSFHSRTFPTEPREASAWIVYSALIQIRH